MSQSHPTPNGYLVTRTAAAAVRVEEDPTRLTKSWAAMLDFAARYPTGREPQWDAFIVRHTRMQLAEIDAALRYRRPRE